MLRSALRRHGVTAVSAALVALSLILVPGSRPASAAAAYTLPGGPFAGRGLYVAPTAAGAVTTTDPATQQILSRLAGVPQAIWLTGGSPSAAASTVSAAVSAAAPAGLVTQFVLYDIPLRDCAGASSGGAKSPAAYQDYVSAIATALAGAHAIVVLEPDALAGLDCLSATDQATRYSLLKWTVGRLAAQPGVLVYLDAGHSTWQSATTMAGRLIKAGIVGARGFALNVSNFDPTPGEISYGRSISAQVGWKRFVIDTSRNGTSPRVAGWCNPAGAALGSLPATPTGYAGADALLWVKRPGESDGPCGTSTAPAGQFSSALAVTLARNAGW